ncbi:taxadiene 5-alpha hydroxylase-like isoform X2 [Vicia villosa]|uniref:taxadiene 5-alpha hydroxylase-like isoform X2 n=1 Tax=Vicia villosa TaxID=3911 RepID=UPI00273AE5E8|nr:taxadiene 5-alpha hydroxylase-like isoform X2 [Vicia villosa]
MVKDIPFIALCILTLSLAFLLKKLLSKSQTKNVPKGSLGYPIIGETLGFLRAQRQDKGYEWLQERVSKYGSVFKTSLMGSPTVIIIGQQGNKFILGSSDDVISAKKPITLQKILGKQSLSELVGSRHRLVKGELLKFLKPECLQNYVKKMDELVHTTLLKELKGNKTIQVVRLMKKLAYDMTSSILFDIDQHTREILFDDFTTSFKAIHSLPINLPGSSFWRGQKARARIVEMILPIMNERRQELSKGVLSSTNDMLSCLLAIRDENDKPLNDDLITDNFVFMFVASHDTSATLMTLMIWKLSRDQEVYNKVLEEQMEILKQRNENEERLTWGEIQKMKYTWRVAQELMRMIPPLFGGFRKALKDTSYLGYDIPKGWQVYWASCGTHMDKDIFENPDKFDPSRFENQTKSIPPFSYLPFGAGSHNCIGNEFARVQTLTTIHNFVKLYEWSKLNPKETLTRQPMPYPSLGLPIKIKPRCNMS